jgi:hypothetical protein
MDRSKNQLAAVGLLWLVLTTAFSILVLGALSSWHDPTWALELQAFEITGLGMYVILWVFWRSELATLLARAWDRIVHYTWTQLVSWIEGAED